MKLYCLDSFSSDLLDIQPSSCPSESATPTPRHGAGCPIDLFAELFSGTTESILPLWEVQLQLVLLKNQASSGQDSAPHPEVHFTPPMQEFQEALRALLKQYEDVISGFAPLPDDPRVKSFLQHSKFDLLMLLENPHPHQRKEAAWPDVQSLLHGYGPYRQSVAYINKTVTGTMKGVQKFTSVSA